MGLRFVDGHALHGVGQVLLCSFLFLLLPSHLLFLCFLSCLLINRSWLDKLDDLRQTWRNDEVNLSYMKPSNEDRSNKTQNDLQYELWKNVLNAMEGLHKHFILLILFLLKFSVLKNSYLLIIYLTGKWNTHPMSMCIKPISSMFIQEYTNFTWCRVQQSKKAAPPCGNCA